MKKTLLSILIAFCCVTMTWAQTTYSISNPGSNITTCTYTITCVANYPTGGLNKNVVRQVQTVVPGATVYFTINPTHNGYPLASIKWSASTIDMNNITYTFNNLYFNIGGTDQRIGCCWGSNEWDVTLWSSYSDFTAVICGTVIPGEEEKSSISQYTEEVADLEAEISLAQIDVKSDKSELAFSATNIYPNPAENQFSIEVVNCGIVTIMDVTGRVLLSMDVASGSRQIDISSLSAGMYIIVFKNSEEMKSFNLIKQ